MIRQSPIFLLALVAYIYFPTFFAWITDASSGWYKPFIVWMVVILGAYILQKRGPRS